MTDAAPPLFFLIAGEASGDVLGARLMDAMQKKAPARFMGVGGPRMIALGLTPLFPSEVLAHVGIAEIARHLPELLRRISETTKAVIAANPAALVTIDCPDFSLRVARRVKKRARAIPIIHYVAPSVWAWRPGRAKKIAAFLDHLLALLPFEPPYFTKEGLACSFVGHPLVESGAGHGDGAAFRARHGIAPDAPVLMLLPGSRRSEVARVLPVFKETLARLAPRYPDLVIAVPSVETRVAEIAEGLKDAALPVVIVTGDDEKYDAMAASRAALACSGTVSIELALAGVPSAIVYKTHPVTAFLARRLVRCRFATLVNIMKDREVMPEYLQGRATPALLTEEAARLLTDEAARAAQKEDLASVASWLGQGSFSPSASAADVVWDVAGRAVKESR